MSASITRRGCLKRFGLIAAASALPWFADAALAFADEAEATPSEIQLDSMAQYARLFMSRYQVPGLSVAIARHGQFVYRKAFGFADQAAGQPATPENLFRIASVSKPVTSVTIFPLVEKNRLALSDRVFGNGGVLGFDYGDNYSARVEKITVEHLLTHTAGGWTNDADDPMFFDPRMSQREVIKWTLREVPLQYEPGQHYAYSNFGYCILGRVVEKVSGQTYEQFVQATVLAKCGVTDMRIGGNTLAQRAPGEVIYYGKEVPNPYEMNVRRMDSHGGWIATASDLVQLAMHVDGFSYTPSILADSTIQTMTAPCTISPIPQYAKGWFVNDVPNWWHSGSLPGTTSIMVRTASGLCWAALANARTPDTLAGLDRLMWDLAGAVPAWRANWSGSGNFPGLTPLRKSPMY